MIEDISKMGFNAIHLIPNDDLSQVLQLKFIIAKMEIRELKDLLEEDDDPGTPAHLKIESNSGFISLGKVTSIMEY